MLYHEIHQFPIDTPIEAVEFENSFFRAHWHTDIELIMVTNGVLTIGINSNQHLLKQGDIAICASGDIHYIDSSNTESKIIVVIFKPEFIDDVFDFAPNKFTVRIPFLTEETMQDLKIKDSEIQLIHGCFLTLLNELKDQYPYFKIIVKSKITELIGLLLRNNNQQSFDDNINTSTGNISLVRKAIRYIENNFSLDISLEDISRHLSVSPYYFSRLFSKTAGMSYKTYLNSVRIEKAIVFLMSTNETIIDIAYECGFNSIRTFNRVFKTVKGYSPSELRK